MGKEDTLVIRVDILGTKYPIEIKREDEEIYRKAAKQLNENILAYKKKFTKHLSEIDYVAMAAFDASVKSLKFVQEKENDPFIATIQALDEQVAGFLSSQEIDTEKEE